jgi:hypothetical protein
MTIIHPQGILQRQQSLKGLKLYACTYSDTPKCYRDLHAILTVLRTSSFWLSSYRWVWREGGEGVACEGELDERAPIVCGTVQERISLRLLW